MSIIDAPRRRHPAKNLRERILSEAVVYDAPMAVRYWRSVGRWSRRPLFARRLVIRERSVQVVVGRPGLARLSGPGRLFDASETTMIVTGEGPSRFRRDCIVLSSPFADQENHVALAPSVETPAVWDALAAAGVTALSQSPVGDGAPLTGA